MSRERWDEGFRVVRCFSTLSRRSGMLSRFMENLTFGITSALALLLARRPDAVYANSWPIVSPG